jgi:hypothetical protein
MCLGAGLAILAAPVAAQETRLGVEGLAPPAADITGLDWLVGVWEGTGIGGAPAQESWTQPLGGTMVGTFIQQKADGSIRFTELMYIRPAGASLELLLKHFNSDMTGWETQFEVERYPLVALEPCAAFFAGLTIRCADRARPGEGLVVAVRAGVDDSGRPTELVFRYARANEKGGA